MSRGTEWIPIDKYLAQEFKSIKREFSMIEAMFSLSLDIDNGQMGSIAGYAALWGWSRNKVRRFLDGVLGIKGHIKDSKRTVKGHAIHFIDKGLWSKQDSKRTVKGQQLDTTNNPKYNNINNTPPISPPKTKRKNKNFTPPTSEEVQKYFVENGYKASAGLKAFRYYDTGNWKDSRGTQVKNWKQKMRGVWFKDENMAVDSNDHHNNFKERKYEGTPEDQISWL